MIVAWLIFCCVFCLAIAVLVVWPIALHPTLPRGTKWLLGMVIFLWLMPLGLLLYRWVGMPAMALF